MVVVRPGEKMPVDGVVVDGRSRGGRVHAHRARAIPVEKSAGDEVFGATINRTGSFRFTATRVGKDTALQQIVKMVQQAQGTKAPIQRLADVISGGIFVPVVIAIAIATFVVWFVFGARRRALHPGADGLRDRCSSSPAPAPWAWPPRRPSWSAPGRAPRTGVLIKGGESLERAHTPRHGRAGQDRHHHPGQAA